MPDCMSAMKKLSPNRGQRRGEEGDRDVIDTSTVVSIGLAGPIAILSANRSGVDASVTGADLFGSSVLRTWRPLQSLPAQSLLNRFVMEESHAFLDLRNLRRAISGKREAAGVLSHLRGRAAVRELEGSED